MSAPGAGYLNLDVSQRLRLIGEIWDSIVDEDVVVPLTDAQIEVVRQRAEHARTHPNDEVDADEADRIIRDDLTRGDT